MSVPVRWQGCALDFESVELRPATREGCSILVNTLLHNSDRMEGKCLGAQPAEECTFRHQGAGRSQHGWASPWDRLENRTLYAEGGCLYAHSPQGRPTVR